MVRILNNRDIELLITMAPEYSGETCSGSGVAYKSLIPPIANHYATNSSDFIDRINKLNNDDLHYLIELMLSGEESLHCLSPEYFALLEQRIKEIAGPDISRKVATRYALECE
jgi:hypothetical protein